MDKGGAILSLSMPKFLNGLLCLLAGLLPSLNAQEVVSLSEETTKPFLAKNCFRCHGNEKKKGGLDLSNRQTALLGGESEIPSIIPKNPMGSEIMTRIISKDEDLIMPPSGENLSKEQIDVIGKWIQQGANWKTGQDRRNLKVPPLSDDYAFIRRVYFDSLGLPPTPNELRRLPFENQQFRLSSFPH